MRQHRKPDALDGPLSVTPVTGIDRGHLALTFALSVAACSAGYSGPRVLERNKPDSAVNANDVGTGVEAVDVFVWPPPDVVADTADVSLEPADVQMSETDAALDVQLVGCGPRHFDPVRAVCVDCLDHDHCPSGTICVGGVCVAGCTSAIPCSAGLTCCAGACVSLTSNPSECGACGVACGPTEQCRSGRCVVECFAGLAACSGTCRDLTRDVEHCGVCGRRCASAGGIACIDSICAMSGCSFGRGDCDGNLSNGCETDVVRDVANCGACGYACSLPRASPTCVGGRCAVYGCDAAFGDCDGDPSNGCESDLRTNPLHCGRCGAPCSSPRMCRAGLCAL